jgi:hypothetical protein
VLAFGCAVMLIAMSDIGGTPTCQEMSSGSAGASSDGECFSGSSFQKAITLGLGWAGGAIAGFAALAALGFAITGRRGRLALRLAGLAVVLGGLSILIANV